MEDVRFAALAEEMDRSVEFRKNHPDYTHRNLHSFLTRPTGEPTIQPSETDFRQDQTQTLWLPCGEADNAVFRHRQLCGKISLLIFSEHPVYWGSICIS